MLRFRGEPRGAWPTWENHRTELWKLLAATLPFDARAFVADRSIFSGMDDGPTGGEEFALEYLSRDYCFEPEHMGSVFLFPAEHRKRIVPRLRRATMPIRWGHTEAAREYLLAVPLIASMDSGGAPDTPDPFVFMDQSFEPHYMKCLKGQCGELDIEHVECVSNAGVLDFFRRFGAERND